MLALKKELSNHPCFNVHVKGQYGRVHLPVAPKCNILCNYCNRKYDCVNESRPGVTSGVLEPFQALEYTKKVLEAEPRISVVGIAGPGDPFANADETIETVRLIHEEIPHMLICLSSNGLRLPYYVDDIAKYGVSHVTVTLNAVDPEIGARVYSWVRDGKVIYRGKKAAELLLSRQLEAISLLKEKNLVVKVNTIVIPGINDTHIMDVAKKIKSMGVDIMNCMAMFPNKETPFENISEPSKEMMLGIRDEAEKIIPQMKHCKRCRADAVGLLDNDKSSEMHGCLTRCSKIKANTPNIRPYVAVATREGMLVNLHLGEAETLQIWGKKDGEYYLLEERNTPEPGTGPERWNQLGDLLKDCSTLLVASVGENPKKILAEKGVRIVQMSGFIEMGLKGVYEGEDISYLKLLTKPCSGGKNREDRMCGGTGDGCG